MKFLQKIGAFFKGVGKLFGLDDMGDVARAVTQVVQFVNLMAPNKTLGEVISVYNQYGLPVTEAMSDGKLDADEIKALLGLGVSKIIKGMYPKLDTTKANMLLNAAYEDIR